MAFENLNYTPESGVGGHVLDLLNYFNYPTYGLAGLAKGLTSEDPNESPLGNLVRGLTGKEEYRFADVMGIPKPDPNADMPMWLAQTAAYEAPDMILSPLNLIFAPAKAAGMFPRIAKATMPFLKEGQSLAGYAASPLSTPVKNYLAGSGAGRLFGTVLPKSHPLYGDIEPLLTEAQRKYSIEPLRTTWADTNTKLSEAMKQFPDVKPADVFEAVERPGSRPDLQPLLDIVNPYWKQKEDLFNQWAHKVEDLGYPRPQSIESTPFYQHMPHMEINSGPTGRQEMARLGNADAYNQPSREIMKWVDETGNEVAIGKIGDKRTGIVPITENGVTEYYHVGPENMRKNFVPDENAIKVRPEPASLAEIKPLTPDKLWQENPLAAIYGAQVQRTQQMKFLDMVQGGLDNGWLIKAEYPAKGRYAIEAPGLEGIYATDKAVANRLNNLANAPYDTSSVWGVMGDTLNRFTTSKAGQALQAVTAPWRELTLAHPGWLAGNTVSNLPQMATEMPWYSIPNAILGPEAATRRGNKLFNSEMALRGISETGQYGAEARSELQKQLKGPGLLERTLGEPGAQAAGAIDTLKKYAVDPIFTVGNKIEQDMKASVVWDWLTRNHPGWEQLPEKERGRVLDQAAQVGHDALLNYSREAMTPFTRDATALVPFLGWNLGIGKRTAELAATKPQKLANLGRTLDATLMPMSPEEERQADPWVRESGPIVGAFGQRFAPNEKGLPTMLQTGRFLPQGVVEQFVKRPADALMSWVNPFIKTPLELAGNYSAFKNRPLDITAGGFPENLANPILQAMGSTSAPYELASNRYFGASVPAAYESVMNLLPQMRHIREINALGANRLWDNPAQEPTTATETGMNFLLGGKMYPYDMARYQKNRKWEDEQVERRLKANLKYAAIQGDEGKVTFYQQELVNKRLHRQGSGTE